MASISRSALVPYTATQMYELVTDVDGYKEFLPWCRDSEVLCADADVVEGRIVIAKGGLEKAFTTRNRHQPGKMIEMRLVEGPFRRLEGFWRFQALSEGASKVSLDLDFEFSNQLVSMVFGKVFTQLANALVDAFVERAEQVYG
ncbi:type II toxin-antitoxin system RatA family toxin [Alkalilimnicola sp. S0819]|uniref:type II toxin-antitoxin system RatA family toxin n=1 Tax=Alkalilimnicola sp. S0819 TaxID=2613922 RepID=UPI00126210B1|nr:type II toxin-antitoxin system RatA family toxin [Alkalilimnicola sp. S0819]KAB7627899.1 type II toxin-antitoxin system RatA family toxin [Alkalilimnicola sp. S0819]MPQ15535.1 ubiquinone-binding protein [Alkalilimnicola sp. S0819]